MGTSRVILASNRLPIDARKVGRKVVVSASPGGLVSGLLPVHEARQGLWFGSAAAGEAVASKSELEARRLVTVRLPKQEARRYYEGFSNRALWPLFHYFTESVEFDRADFDAYRSVNERFADAIARHARSEDLIWIHDYHLLLLPALIRRRVPNARIGFFLHIPFPAAEVFRTLPVREELLEGLLGADLVGFQTHDHARNMAATMRRLLGVELDLFGRVVGGRARLGVFPIQVDFQSFVERAKSPEVDEHVAKWRRRTAGRKVVLGIDRLDYSKGLLGRLEAYRRLLSNEPRWAEEAVFIQVAVPTRSSIQRYQWLRRDVERLVGHLNGLFGSAGDVPIRYLYRSLSAAEVSALYRLADVAVVTPIRDGMNLVAKEYVASRIDDTGALVLGELAGSASELGESFVVNPHDPDQTAAAIHRALCLSHEEQTRRMEAMRLRLKRRDVHRWCDTFLDTLEQQAVSPAAPNLAQEGWQDVLRAAFARAKKPLLVLDYDGTLTNLVAHFKDAAPDAALLRLLKALSVVGGPDVLVVSGRDRKTLEAWLGAVPIHLAAEHGFFFRPAGQEWRELIPPHDRYWVDAVRPILVDWQDRVAGSMIEEKECSLAWHYRQADPEAGPLAARELAHHLVHLFANAPIQILRGHQVVEVRHQTAHKGLALRHVLMSDAHDFILVAGDDRTDEDMFETAPLDAWSIKIGSPPTHARYSLGSPAELRALLMSLVPHHESARATDA